ncbi:hypothetical protein [Paenibacillus rhizoplanae]|uniref:hypothetical protein n=1 Tax=Paenibacillus rhizoplanae TaxID=1917181 RepID=UPI00360E6C88
MKRKRQGKLGSTGKGKRRRPLLSRKTRIRKGPGRKSRKGLLGKPGKKSLQLRRKKTPQTAAPQIPYCKAAGAGHTGYRAPSPAAGDSAPPRIWASRRNSRRETPISRATPKHTTWGSTQVSPRASRTGISWSSADRAAGTAAEQDCGYYRGWRITRRPYSIWGTLG